MASWPANMSFVMKMNRGMQFLVHASHQFVPGGNDNMSTLRSDGVFCHVL
jgi:hypothetical protein